MNKIQNQKRARGRPRQFDEKAVLQIAAEIFLNQGYEAPSYESLGEQMGLSKPSLYGHFGDKQALFEQVLKGYSKMALTNIRATFSNQKSLKAAVHELFAEIATLYSKNPDHSKGCLIIGAALPSSSHNEKIQGLVTEFIQELQSLFQEIIQHKYKYDLKQSGKTSRQVSTHITSLIFAIAIRARIGTTRKSLLQTAKEHAALVL